MLSKNNINNVCMFLFFITLLLLAGCGFKYRGDGEYIYNGFFASHRHELYFGRVEDATEELNFNIGYLPEEHMNIGLETKIENSEPFDKSKVQIIVKDNQENEIIINQTESLEKMRWGQIIGENKHQNRFLRINSFSPIHKHTYTISFKMIERDPNGVPLNLMIEGEYRMWVP